MCKTKQKKKNQKQKHLCRITNGNFGKEKETFRRRKRTRRRIIYCARFGPVYTPRSPERATIVTCVTCPCGVRAERDRYLRAGVNFPTVSGGAATSDGGRLDGKRSQYGLLLSKRVGARSINA